MDLTATTESVHAQLAAAAALGDEATKRVAHSLAAALDAAIRLTVVRAVSEFADEASAALLDQPGAPRVTARVDGDQLVADISATAEHAEPATDALGGEATARISLRLSDALKNSIDEAAGRAGVSVNTWLVRAANTALAEPRTARRGAANRMTGWVSG